MIRLIGWLFGLKPPRTFESVVEELIAGLADGSIVPDPPLDRDPPLTAG